MSVEFRTGPFRGMSVTCKWCKQILTTGSDSDYKKCDNCGGLHGIGEPEPAVFKSVYNWYYYKRVLLSLLPTTHCKLDRGY